MVFLNAENLLDVRLTDYQPLVRPQAGPGGRWTVDAWAPLEGSMINLGVRLVLP
jgi:iron complex outermembrane receptor protein